MSKETIKVRKQEGSNKLLLSSEKALAPTADISTKVNPGSTVIWKIDPDGGIDQITAIKAKPESQHVFTVVPTPVEPDNPKSDWTATISNTSSTKQSYEIAYRVGTTTHSDDPILDMEDPD